jgi:hypothetical protein
LLSHLNLPPAVKIVPVSVTYLAPPIVTVSDSLINLEGGHVICPKKFETSLLSPYHTTGSPILFLQFNFSFLFRKMKFWDSNPNPLPHCNSPAHSPSSIAVELLSRFSLLPSFFSLYNFLCALHAILWNDWNNHC